MKTTKLLIRLLTCSLLTSAAIVQAQSVPAYAPDTNTVLLDHFDGSSAGSILGFRAQPCGPPNPTVPPNSSFMPSRSDLAQALCLQKPAGEPDFSGSYVKYPGGQLLSIPNGTVECWVYLEALGTPHNTAIVQQYPYPGACAGNTFNIYVNAAGQLSSDAWNAFSVNSGSALVPVKQWFHTAVSWGGAGARLYLNGALVGTDSNTGYLAPGYGGSVIVRAGSELPGASNRVDELRISNVQRTSFNLPVTRGVVVTAIKVDPMLRSALGVNTDGTNFFVNTYGLLGGDGKIMRFSYVGGPVNICESTWGVSGVLSPLAITRAGTNLYWVDSNSGPGTGTQVLKCSTECGPVTSIYTGSTITDGSGITTDGTRVFVADEVQGRVFGMNLDGSALAQVGPTRYGGFFDTEHANAIAWHNGLLYVADSGKAGVIEPQVVVIPATSGAFTPLHVGAPFVSPNGIAVADGQVFVADEGAKVIWTMPLSGGAPVVYAADPRFKSLRGLSHHNGVLYAADSGDDSNGTIWQIAPAIRPSIRCSQVTIPWDSVLNATYRIDYRSDLTTNTWQPLFDCIRGTGGPMKVTDEVPESSARRFYRVYHSNCMP